jgi:hypothetical protein
LFGSVLVSTQVLLHLVVPPPHTSSQLLPLQICPDEQGALQEPQCAGSAVVSTHLLPHLVSPPEQTRAHLPPEHVSPEGHEVPQVPQLKGST